MAQFRFGYADKKRKSNECDWSDVVINDRSWVDIKRDQRLLIR
ncbi:hypothetical protein NMY25_000099 [Wohlfahrtiimonas chitiniclastica]|nr:hypothetical protein [Wohlfahrtiimonas chitiniclastica]